VIPSVSPGQSGASLLENTVLIRIVTKTGLYIGKCPIILPSDLSPDTRCPNRFKEFLDNFIELKEKKRKKKPMPAGYRLLSFIFLCLFFIQQHTEIGDGTGSVDVIDLRRVCQQGKP
jgi:hypothetical protein